MIIEIPDITKGVTDDIIDRYCANLIKRMSFLMILCRDYNNVMLINNAMNCLSKIDIKSEREKRGIEHETNKAV